MILGLGARLGCRSSRLSRRFYRNRLRPHHSFRFLSRCFPFRIATRGRSWHAHFHCRGKFGRPKWSVFVDSSRCCTPHIPKSPPLTRSSRANASILILYSTLSLNGRNSDVPQHRRKRTQKRRQFRTTGVHQSVADSLTEDP